MKLHAAKVLHPRSSICAGSNFGRMHYGVGSASGECNLLRAAAEQSSGDTVGTMENERLRQIEQQVREIIRRAMANLTLVRQLEVRFEYHKAEALKDEDVLRDLNRRREAIHQEIKALGFHDIGDARTVIDKLDKEQAAQREMTPEERLKFSGQI